MDAGIVFADATTEWRGSIVGVVVIVVVFNIVFVSGGGSADDDNTANAPHPEKSCHAFLPFKGEALAKPARWMEEDGHGGAAGVTTVAA